MCDITVSVHLHTYTILASYPEMLREIMERT